MKLRYKVVAIAVTMLFIASKCERKIPVFTEPLPEDVTAVVHVTPTGTIVRDHISDKPTVVPDYGHGVDVVIDDKGKVTAKPKTFGFSWDWGVAYAGGHMKPEIYFGCEILYWRRLGLLTGINYPKVDRKTNAYVGVGYRIPYRKLSNLSPFVGYTVHAEPIVGIFWRFGSS